MVCCNDTIYLCLGSLKYPGLATEISGPPNHMVFGLCSSCAKAPLKSFQWKVPPPPPPSPMQPGLWPSEFQLFLYLEKYLGITRRLKKKFKGKSERLQFHLSLCDHKMLLQGNETSESHSTVSRSRLYGESE